MKHTHAAGRCDVTVGTQQRLAESLCFVPVKAKHADCICSSILLFGFRLALFEMSHGNTNGNLLHFAVTLLVVNSCC
jgi:hypothetical protein